MWKHAVFSLAAMAVVCAAPLAEADTLGTSGYAYGSQSFTLIQGGTQSAGGFAGTWNSAGIEFWCIELNQQFGFGGSYSDYVATVPNSAIFTMLGQLFTQAHSAANDSAMNSAAFQLAIWEIVYDSDLNLGGGDFRVLGGNAATVALAQSWLSALGNFSDNYHLVLLHSATHQDFVTFGNPFRHLVPEPAPLVLLTAALLAVLVVRRRRESRIGA
jgi:hypothetical protein